MAAVVYSGKVRKEKKLKSSRLSSPTDEPWKDIISYLFKDFMELLFPAIHAEIDWDKGFEFLEQELQSIIKYGKKGKRHADKLVKVWHKRLGETYILLHIEIQAEKEVAFSMRIFDYYYRIWEKHHAPVVCLAILIDKDTNWRPNTYEAKMWDCNLKLEYPILKLIDFESKREMLEKSNNPFALVILSQLAALKSKRNADIRFTSKFNLCKALLKKNQWPKEKITSIFKFLDGILRMSETMESKFKQVLTKEVGAKKMSYITSFEYFGEKRGITLGQSRALITQLKTKYKSVPRKYRKLIQSADSENLNAWLIRFVWAKSINEIFE